METVLCSFETFYSCKVLRVLFYYMKLGPSPQAHTKMFNFSKGERLKIINQFLVTVDFVRDHCDQYNRLNTERLKVSSHYYHVEMKGQSSLDPQLQNDHQTSV